MKKYHKIIQELETIANIQLQIQDIVKQADTINNQLADINTILLQAKEIYKIEIRGDIYSISEKLYNITYGDMEKQVHHIQILLADKLDQYKGKEVEIVNEYVKTLQEAYQRVYKRD